MPPSTRIPPTSVYAAPAADPALSAFSCRDFADREYEKLRFFLAMNAIRLRRGLRRRSPPSLRASLDTQDQASIAHLVKSFTQPAKFNGCNDFTATTSLDLVAQLSCRRNTSAK